MLGSVLVALDLSPLSARTAARAALLPLAAGSHLTLLHVMPWLRRAQTRRGAGKAARAALEELASDLAPSLGREVRLRTEVRSGPAASEIAKQAHAARAELLVVGRGGHRALRDALLGSTAERVVRQSRVPVLAVRNQPRGPYRRPLLAVDLDDAAPPVLAVALRLFAPPRPQLALVHAYGGDVDDLARYDPLLADELAESQRASWEAATYRVAQLLAIGHQLARGEELAWEPMLRRGSATRVVPKAVTKRRADLLVVGTHARSSLSQVFLGTVAGDLLRAVRCDVMVVPPGAVPAH